MAQELDAIVLADDPLAQTRIAGLRAHERAARVARRAGATRVLVLDGTIARQTAIAWRTSIDEPRPLLVIRANQLVHTPLVTPLVAAFPRTASSAPWALMAAMRGRGSPPAMRPTT